METFAERQALVKNRSARVASTVDDPTHNLQILSHVSLLRLTMWLCANILADILKYFRDIEVFVG